MSTRSGPSLLTPRERASPNPRRCACASFLALAVLLAGGLAFGAAGDDEAGRKGDALLAEIDKSNDVGDRMIRMRMRLLDGGGSVREWRIKVVTKGESKRLLRFLSPPNMKGTEILILSPDVQYVYAPGERRVRRVAQHFERQGLMGSDLTPDEFARVSYGDTFKARLLSTKGEEQVLELRPRPGRTSPWARMIMTVVPKYRNFIKLDYYDARGQRVRQQVRSEFMAVGLNRDCWVPRRVVFVDLARKHATEAFIEDYHVGLGIPEQVFSVSSLGRSSQWLRVDEGK